MSAQHRPWRLAALIGLIVITVLACALPTAATPTPTPTLPAGSSTGGTGGVGGTGGTGGSNGGAGGNNGGAGGTGGINGGSSTVAPTQLPEPFAGPYTVQQIETLGGEAISGMVCSLIHPFTVLSATPHVTFSFIFAPQDAKQGKVSYAYSITSAGESHQAAGTYSLTPVDKAGTLQLSLAVSDHVVFKGFDGNIPNRYKFNLVPSPNTPCP